ncbi:integrase arm-type DNA-binding domain-containing protein [Escherichia coli]|uniref:tyrosine-type recombinase/integrase n=1 Tax=Escherichia coli TaxID=562 RepID=UPI0017CCBFA5|nr:integrase arm-type DNA-binding domain-containing protein [Escherichia coli]EER8373175.1 integrase arm-type DNA-binding domain-containing protein [Escherichia coli]EFL6141016.1 integrase arm-type DNA-binding domain-containing protein [Escherichia coli]
MKKLTDSQVKSATAPDKPIKLFDGDGLYLYVAVSGRKTWRLKYKTRAGKWDEIAIGKYPVISLAEARQIKNSLLADIAKGIDIKAQPAPTETLQDAITAWIDKHCSNWSAGYLRNVRSAFRHVPAAILRRPVTSITAAELVEVVESVRSSKTGQPAPATGNKLAIRLREVFRYAETRGIVSAIVAERLPRAAKEPPATHRRATDDVKALARDLLADLDTVARKASTVLLLTACRTREITRATWSEIDFTTSTLTVPAARTKMRREHVVYLSAPVIAILRTLHTPGSPPDGYIFRSPRNPARPIGPMAILQTLDRIGWLDRTCAHGFRAAFSTAAHAQRRFSHQAIEMCLGHCRKSVSAAYNRYDYQDERIELMRWWAAYLCDGATLAV